MLGKFAIHVHLIGAKADAFADFAIADLRADANKFAHTVAHGYQGQAAGEPAVCTVNDQLVPVVEARGRQFEENFVRPELLNGPLHQVQSIEIPCLVYHPSTYVPHLPFLTIFEFALCCLNEAGALNDRCLPFETAEVTSDLIKLVQSASRSKRSFPIAPRAWPAPTVASVTNWFISATSDIFPTPERLCSWRQ